MESSIFNELVHETSSPSAAPPSLWMLQAARRQGQTCPEEAALPDTARMELLLLQGESRRLEPELGPAAARLWWRAVNVTCLAASQSGEEDWRGICTAEPCQRALVMPFLSILAQPVRSKSF